MKKNHTRITSLVLSLVMLVAMLVPSMSASAATPVYYKSCRASAGTYVVANMSEFDCGVNVYKSASYSSTRLTTIHCNVPYQYISKTSDANGRPWFKIYYSGSKSGYVCGYYAHTVTVDNNRYVISPASGVNMRKGPGTGYDSYGTTGANTYYSVIGAAGEYFSVSGAKWIQCMDNSNRVFWLKDSLLAGRKINANIECDSSDSSYMATDYHFVGASNMRSGPSTSYGKVRSSTFSTKCTVYISGMMLNTSNEIWYKVSITDGGVKYTGYVLGTLLK